MVRQFLKDIFCGPTPANKEEAEQFINGIRPTLEYELTNEVLDYINTYCK